MTDKQDPNEWLLQEIWINRKACEAAIQEHLAGKAKRDQDYQRFMLKVLDVSHR